MNTLPRRTGQDWPRVLPEVPAVHMAAPVAPLRDVVDVALADESADVGCISELVAMTERSAGLVDDGMNCTEASEERHALAESQAMR